MNKVTFKELKADDDWCKEESDQRNEWLTKWEK